MRRWSVAVVVLLIVTSVVVGVEGPWVVPAGADPVRDSGVWVCSGEMLSGNASDEGEAFDVTMRFEVPAGSSFSLTTEMWLGLGPWGVSFDEVSQSEGSAVPVSYSASGVKAAPWRSYQYVSHSFAAESSARLIVMRVHRDVGTSTLTDWSVTAVVSPGAADCVERVDAQDPSGLQGDPVDVATGNLVDALVDLPAPVGVSPLVSVMRSLNTLTSGGGSLGPGWRGGFDVELRPGLRGRMELREASGEVRDLWPVGGLWSGPAGYRAVAEPAVGAGWVLRRPDGVVDRFDAAGRLVERVDRAGGVVSISRSGSGAVVSVASGGYSLAFEDSLALNSAGVPVAGSDGLVDRVVSSDGRVVQYGYVRDPVAGVTVLGWVSEPHSLAQSVASPRSWGRTRYVTSSSRVVLVWEESTPGGPEHVVLENTFDERGRVVGQEFEGGATTMFQFNRRPADLVSGYEGTLVVEDGWTTVDFSSGDRIVYQYADDGRVIAAYDPHGQQVGRTWTDRRPTSHSSRSGVESSVTYDAAGRPVTVTETVGAVSRGVASYSYLTAATTSGAAQDLRLTSVTDRAGVTTEFGYAAPTDAHPSEVRTPCDPASSAVTCPSGGRVTTEISYSTTSGHTDLPARIVDPQGVKTEFTYHADRSLATVKTFPSGSVTLTTSIAYATPASPGWTEPDERVVKIMTVTAPDAAVTVTKFDASGRVVEVRDPLYDGSARKGTRYTYSADGVLTSVTDPADAVTVLQDLRAGTSGWPVDAPAAAVKTQIVTDPVGVQSIAFFDASSQKIETWRGKLSTPSSLAKTRYVFGRLGRLEKVIDPVGVQTHYAYDAEGRVVSSTAGPSDSDAAHQSTTTYDVWGQVSSVTGPSEMAPGSSASFNSQVAYTYDAAGRVRTMIEGAAGPAGEKVMSSYSYDAAGRPWRTVEHRGGSTDTASVPAIAPGDHVTETRYTLAGRTDQVLAPGPDNASFDWSGPDSTKSVTKYSYDGAGRMTTVTDARGKVATTSYDSAGRVDVVTSPEGRWVDYSYDLAGQLTGVTRPSGLSSPSTVTASRSYDAVGRLTADADFGASTGRLYEYDLAGRLTKAKDALGRETTYGYDERGNRATRTSLDDLGNSQTESWAWDLADNVVAHTMPPPLIGGSAQTTNYGYDYGDADPANDYGYLATVADPTGRVEARAYYGSGSLKSVSHTAPGLPTVSSQRTLNSRGWLTSVVDSTGPTSRTTSYTYDRAGQRTGQTTPEGTVAYAWDLAGNLRDLQYPDGAKFRYKHLKTGQNSEFQAWSSGAGAYMLIANYSYDDDGLETHEWIFGSGGNTRDWTRNLAGQVTDYDQAMNTGSGWETYTADLAYDQAGRLASETVNAGTPTAITYDAAGQVTGQTGTNPASYAYGTRGNRLTSSLNGLGTTYTTNPNGSVATATTGSTVIEYGYDNAGRRTTETTKDSGTTIRTVTTAYDAAGRPATRTAAGASPSTETRRYDGNGQIVELDYTTAGSTANYDLVWDTTASVPQPLITKVNGSLWSRMDYSNRRLSYKSGFYPKWYKLDARGSAIKATANPNAADAPTGYDPYGTPAGSAWFGSGYRSESHLIDQIHLRNRDYDPTTGQFTTQDPLDGINGTATLTNPYHYTNNDPYNLVDPLGLRAGDGAFTDGQIGAACDSVGGRIVWYGGDGTRICMEPPAGRVEGGECFPPVTPGGDAIVFHNGACSVLTVEVVCDHGAFAPGLNRICRNGDALIAGLTVVAVGALGVATGGAAVVLLGGSAGIMIPTGGALAIAGGGTAGGGIVLSPAAAGALTGTYAGLVSLIHMASGDGLHGDLHGGEGGRDIEASEIRTNADEVYFQEDSPGVVRQVFVQHVSASQRLVAIYEAGGPVATVFRLSAGAVASRVADGRWFTP